MKAGRLVLAAVATVLVMFSLVTVADAHHHLVDLTTNNSLTLTPQTRAVVRGVRRRVELTAFLGADDPGRSEAAALLEQYHRANRRIHYRVVGANDAPALVRSLSVDPTVDVLAAADGKFVARAPTVTEQDVTSVLAQVERRVRATVCFTTGHGESDTTSEEPNGLAAALRLLSSNGYTTRTIDLLSQPTVPVDCAELVVAGPTAPLDQAADAVVAYLAHNGRALILGDPESTVDLSAVLDPYSLSLDRGITFDADPSHHLPDDVATIIARSYRSTSPVVRGLAPTLFPGAEAVVIGAAPGGLSTTPLVQTGDASYLERHPEHPGFTKSEDRAGPITLVAAADRSRVTGPNRIERSRVVVTGDVDFATNGFIGEGGNARLLVQSVDWLVTQEDLVPLNANLPPYRPLALTRARTASARVLSVGVVPGLFVLAGLAVWALRRRS